MTYHYHSIDDDRDNASTGVMTLYDAHFRVVGMWSERAGRAMLGDAFYVREDATVGREGIVNDERDYARVDLSRRTVDPIDQTSQIDCRTYQTNRSSTRQSVNDNISISYQG